MTGALFHIRNGYLILRFFYALWSSNLISAIKQFNISRIFLLDLTLSHEEFIAKYLFIK